MFAYEEGQPSGPVLGSRASETVSHEGADIQLDTRSNDFMQ